MTLRLATMIFSVLLCLCLVQGFVPPGSSSRLHSLQTSCLERLACSLKPTQLVHRRRPNNNNYGDCLCRYASEEQDGTTTEEDRDPASVLVTGENKKSWMTIASLAVISFLYWYWLVLGAAVNSAGLPGIPDWLPMTPGWPPSDADFAPAVQDSVHFFYLSDLLGTDTTTIQTGAAEPPVLRLALFNIAEAWIFAFLPLLWSDRQRLPRPVLLFTWVGALGLTNAFLAPYLFFSEVFAQEGMTTHAKNQVVSVLMGIVASLVVGYATLQVTTQVTLQDWTDFWGLVTTDRTYLAFCVDLGLFSLFQSMLLSRVQENEATALDKVPFVGLVAWLLRP